MKEGEETGQRTHTHKHRQRKQWGKGQRKGASGVGGRRQMGKMGTSVIVPTI